MYVKEEVFNQVTFKKYLKDTNNSSFEGGIIMDFLEISLSRPVRFCLL